MTPVYQHSVGVVLKLTLPASLSTAGATVTGELRKPDRTLVGQLGVVVSGQDVAYTSKANDLAQLGEYSFAAVLDYASGSRLVSEPLHFRVWARGRQADLS